MTHQEFIEYALVAKKIEYHSYGGSDTHYQCVDLANYYIDKVMGLSAIIGVNAKDFPEKITSGLEYVANTPDYIPGESELAVWNGRVGSGAGHIAVTLKGCTKTVLKTIDQNWSKKQEITLENHNYNNIRGFIRKKADMAKTYTQEEWQIERDERNKNWDLYKDAENKLLKLKTEFAQLVNEKNQLYKDMASLETKLADSESDLSYYLGKIAELTQQIDQNRQEIEKLNKQLLEKPKDSILLGKRKLIASIFTPLIAIAVKILSEKYGIEI